MLRCTVWFVQVFVVFADCNANVHRGVKSAAIAIGKNSRQGTANAMFVQYQTRSTIHPALLRSRTSCVPSCLDVPNTNAADTNARSGLRRMYSGNANQLTNGVRAMRKNAINCIPMCFIAECFRETPEGRTISSAVLIKLG